MKQVNLLLTIGLILLLVSCGGKKSKTENADTSAETATEQADDYKAIAEDYCACMRPMADLYKKIKELTAAGDVDGLTDLMDELETTSEAADDCVDNVYEKHGEVEDEASFEARFRQECPEVAALIAEMDEEEG